MFQWKCRLWKPAFCWEVLTFAWKLLAIKLWISITTFFDLEGSTTSFNRTEQWEFSFIESSYCFLMVATTSNAIIHLIILVSHVYFCYQLTTISKPHKHPSISKQQVANFFHYVDHIFLCYSKCAPSRHHDHCCYTFMSPVQYIKDRRQLSESVKLVKINENIVKK